ncbi:coiled-coil domain-containing protein [Risungbinella massiliensis]|uniref:hypothetical protein n=1 Tax=Risungbinella massiliensis TaxID=1329796 RepID=UPI0005CBF9F9|nr:hypothetical protein [Risungbinella massiliensis]
MFFDFFGSSSNTDTSNDREQRERERKRDKLKDEIRDLKNDIEHSKDRIRKEEMHLETYEDDLKSNEDDLADWKRKNTKWGRISITADRTLKNVCESEIERLEKVIRKQKNLIDSIKRDLRDEERELEKKKSELRYL